MTPSGGGAERRPRGRRGDGVALLLALAAWAFNPYVYGVSDHTYKIPFLKATWDPSLYARDLTVQMKSAYVSVFSMLAWPLASSLGLPLAFFVIQAVTLLAFFLLIARLGAALTGERAIGWFAVLLLFFPQEVAGGIATFDVMVEERFVGFVLILASLLLMTRGRALIAGLLAGLAGAVHLVTLANFLLAAGCLLGLELVRPGARRTTLSRAARFLAGLIVGVLPVLVIKARGPAGGLTTWIDPDWLRMILLRSGNHFLPDAGLFARHVLMGAALLILTWRWRAERRVRVLLAAALLSTIAGFALATLFATRVPWLLGLQLSLFRTDQLFMIVAAVATAWLAARLASARPALALLAVVVFSFLAMRERLVLLSALALVSLVVRSRPAAAEAIRRPLGAPMMAAGLALFLGVALARGHRPHWDHPLRPAQSPSLEVQRWLHANTNRDALVMVPPGDTDFRIVSERAVLGTWKDWTYNVLSREFAFTMLERLHDLGGVSLATCSNGDACERAALEHYARLPEREVMALARRYGVDVVVRPADAPLAWPPVFQNAGYRVYAIAPGAAPEPNPRAAPR